MWTRNREGLRSTNDRRLRGRHERLEEDETVDAADTTTRSNIDIESGGTPEGPSSIRTDSNGTNNENTSVATAVQTSTVDVTEDIFVDDDDVAVNHYLTTTVPASRETVTTDTFTTPPPATSASTFFPVVPAVSTDTNINVTPRQRLQAFNEIQAIRQRRRSICTFLASIILLRLWVSALIGDDFALFYISLVMSCWFIRWIRITRAEEMLLRRRSEELSRRVDEAEAINDDIAGVGSGNSDTVSGGLSAEDFDMNVMSFQAQLSMAILESRRHILENGGFGRPDGANDDDGRGTGVSEPAKKKWTTFLFQEQKQKGDLIKNKTGESMTNCKGTKLDGNGDDDHGKYIDEYDEAPTCSICLCEYEPKESMVRLPCCHVYHYDCIDNWCRNHINCPLCNFDLEKCEGYGCGDGGSDGLSVV